MTDQPFSGGPFRPSPGGPNPSSPDPSSPYPGAGEPGLPRSLPFQPGLPLSETRPPGPLGGPHPGAGEPVLGRAAPASDERSPELPSGFGAGVDSAPVREEAKEASGGAGTRSSGRRRGRRQKPRAEGGGEPVAASADAERSADAPAGDAAREGGTGDGEEGAGGGAKKSRRRGKRGGRRRKKGLVQSSAAPATAGVRTLEGAEESAATGAAAPKDGAASTDKKRGRGSRGGRGRKRAAAVEVEGIPGEDDDLLELPGRAGSEERTSEEEDAGGRGEKRSAKTSKRSRRKKKSSGSTEEGSSPRARRAEKKTKRKAKRRGRGGEDEDEEAPVRAAQPQKPRKILINAADPEETRVVVVEEGRIVDLQMTVKKHASYVSDIYRGRVVNLEPAIGAAFVDFGQGKNGFLHASDVLPCYGESDFKLEKLLTTPVDEDDWSESSHEEAGADDEDEDETPHETPRSGGDRRDGRRGRGRGSARTRRPRLPIEKLLKKGQMVCVQITKDAIGDKGPTLTTYISIPGRYLVLMPSLARTGVSRKIDDDRERRRLKRILSGLNVPDGMGVIVRTAGVGCTKAELQRDLEYLLAAWEDFSRRLVSGRNPAPLYQESDVAIRTMRDLFTANVEAVIVDDEEVHDRVVEFTKKLMPEHVGRIELHESARPLLQSQGVEPDFEKIFSKRVELPSGGSIVIEQTEALVAIDVNSGRTREEGAGFEEIALKTNLEAVPEIARQIRLRDLGGIIVLDYIDMMRSGSRRAVERATREELRADRARSKVGRISQFGLLELTRQRLGPGLNKLVYETCRACRGSGRRRTASSRAQAILRRLAASLVLKGFTTVEVRTHPDTIEHLEKHLSSALERLEEDSGRKIVLLSVPDQLEDSVLHYLRADGREVRPGGRRKRR